MNLHKLILTENACYKAGRTIAVKGIMVHSTGANNPSLKRYVGPNDGLLGENKYNNHWNQDRPGGRQVCVHAFIGRLADGTIACSAVNLYQSLVNAINFGVAEETAVRAASYNPACAIGADKQIGTIEDGKLADFIICSPDYAKKRVFLGGKEL